MTGYSNPMSGDLPCHLCGYDLLAHPGDGKCPRCGASLAEAESRQLAAIPPQLAWRDRDPRWRRRMLAGAWVLVFLPLMDVLQTFDWASGISMPTLFHSWGTGWFQRIFSAIRQSWWNLAR